MRHEEAFKNDKSEYIYENYDRFIHDNNQYVNSPTNAMKMLTEDSLYDSYIASLTSHLDERGRNVAKRVCDRAREDFIQESVVGPSAQAIGYNVMSYVTLIDIYSNPQLIKMLNTHTINKSMFSIPKNETYAYIKQTNGTTIQTKIPKSTSLIRGASENITINPSTTNNLYLKSIGNPNTITADSARVNNRHFMIDTITMSGTDGTDTIDTVVKVSVRADARVWLIPLTNETLTC